MICENEEVTDFQVDEHGVSVTTGKAEYRVQALVAADGSKGVVRQRLNRQSRRQQIAEKEIPLLQVARLLETILPADHSSPLFSEHYAEFDFTPVDAGLQGYCWDFPSWVRGEPNYNRGIYDARVALRRPRADLPGLLGGYLESRQPKAGSTEIEGHPIHWFSPRSALCLPTAAFSGGRSWRRPIVR